MDKNILDEKRLIELSKINPEHFKELYEYYYPKIFNYFFPSYVYSILNYDKLCYRARYASYPMR